MTLSEDKAACETCVTTKELTTLYDIAAMIANQHDLQTSLEKSMKILKNSLHLSNCTVHIIEDEMLNVFASIDLSSIQKNYQVIKLERVLLVWLPNQKSQL